jgi:hypothetical protein
LPWSAIGDRGNKDNVLGYNATRAKITNYVQRPIF